MRRLQSACWQASRARVLQLIPAPLLPPPCPSLCAGLCPEDSPELWAAACCSHDEETPLGLACRMNKRGLLAALAVHGVPAAGAMLAALQLQDRRVLQPVAALAAAVSGKRGKAGAQQLLTTHAEEESLQQEEWAKLLCTQPAAACKGSVPVDGLTAGNVLKHVPASAAEPGRFSHAAATAAPLLAGAKLPDSVLPLRTLPGCCSACSAMDLLSAHSGKGKCVHAHSLSSGSSSTSDSESSDGDGDWRASLAALHKSVGRKDGAASFYLPYQAEQLEQCQLASSHFKGGSPLWAFRDGTLERSFRTWHMGEVAKVGSQIRLGWGLGFGTVLRSLLSICCVWWRQSRLLAWHLACLARDELHCRQPLQGLIGCRSSLPPEKPSPAPPLPPRSWTPLCASWWCCCCAPWPACHPMKCAARCTCGCSQLWHARR